MIAYEYKQEGTAINRNTNINSCNTYSCEIQKINTMLHIIFRILKTNELTSIFMLHSVCP